MNELKTRAPVIEAKETSKLYAEIVTCPLRIAFVIREDIDPARLAQILEFNSLVWGGYYNCLVPTDGKTIAQDWWHNLLLYRPDKVVFCGDNGQKAVSSELLAKVQNELQPFLCSDWNKPHEQNDIVQLHGEGIADRLVNAMPMVYPLQHIIDNLSSTLSIGRETASRNSRGNGPFCDCDFDFLASR